MVALVSLLYGLLFLLGIGGLVCFILVVVQMFKHEQSGLAITCIILTFCTGIGPLIGFVYGWIKSKDWNLKKVMLAWTGIFVAQLLLVGVLVAVVVSIAADSANQLPKELEDIEFNIEDGNMEFDLSPPEGFEVPPTPQNDLDPGDGGTPAPETKIELEPAVPR